MVPVAVVAAWIGLVERLAALWQRVTGRPGPPPPPDTNPGAMSRLPGTTRHRIPREGGGVGIGEGLAWAFVALVVVWFLATGWGCTPPRSGALKLANPPPVTLNTVQEVADYAALWAPCEACPKCPDSPEPAPVNPGGGVLPPPAPADPGNQVPPEAPPAPDAGATRDEIPFDSVRWSGGDPRGYKLTAGMSGLRIAGKLSGPATVCFDWSRPSWPNNGAPKPSDGNLWWIARIGGRWEGGVWEMTAPKFARHVCRQTEAKRGQPPMIQAHGPVAEWYPKHGEQVCQMVTTITRGGVPSNSPRERGPIVCGRWP